MSPAAPSLARRERLALCDLLGELGPDVPTLCEGWRSADLAAHLYVREHRPDAGLGLAAKLGPITAWSEKVQGNARDTMGWGSLIEAVRTGPPLWWRPLDPAFNTVEYFVHHEDLRRAQPEWQPRALAPEDAAELWRRLAGLAKLQGLMAKARPGHRPAASRYESEGLAPIMVGDKPGPRVNGAPGDVLLWALGRRQAARVDVA
jgi:uncharacterized protein (TIGR03085 family)